MNFHARVDNRTPFEVECRPMDDRRGRPVFVAVAKLTYRVGPAGVARIAVPGAPVRLADDYVGEGVRSFLRRPSDWVDEKPGTDVIVLGTAIPPTGRSVSELDVSVQVGSLQKSVRVFGPRVYQQGLLGKLTPGPAQRLVPTPLGYDLAFGGIEEKEGSLASACADNPSGVGWAESRAGKVGAPAHRIENRKPALGEAREPAGFGPVGPHWAARLGFAGTRDAEWQRKRAPLHPRDFDPRHNGVAHPDLHSATPLRPDEPAEILGMTESGAWRFKLPAHAPRFSTVLDGAETQHDTHLDTFLIDADEGTVELVWRVSTLLPRKAQRLSRVIVRAEPEVPVSTLERPPAEHSQHSREAP